MIGEVVRELDQKILQALDLGALDLRFLHCKRYGMEVITEGAAVLSET